MNSVLEQMTPIGLDDMKAVRLMNRVDQKYMASFCQLEELLGRVAGQYYVQHIADDIYMLGWGKSENDNKCMSVYDFATEKELISVSLANPKNFTYRCVYYD
jgi:hypothetical protein